MPSDKDLPASMEGVPSKQMIELRPSYSLLAPTAMRDGVPSFACGPATPCSHMQTRRRLGASGPAGAGRNVAIRHDGPNREPAPGLPSSPDAGPPGPRLPSPGAYRPEFQEDAARLPTISGKAPASGLFLCSPPRDEPGMAYDAFFPPRTGSAGPDTRCPGPPDLGTSQVGRLGRRRVLHRGLTST